MNKYYRVIKENPLWEIDAILKNDGDMYQPIEDIWDKFEEQEEYLSVCIIEDSPDFFERVYRSETEKMVFRTGEEMKKLFKSFIPEKKVDKK